MKITAFELAQRFIGTKEVSGTMANPLVLAMLRLEDGSAQDDAIAWCSAFVNWIAWLLRLPRSKSLAARSWLAVGTPVSLDHARPGYDVVVLSRGSGPQPGPDVPAAPGHVGWFAGLDGLHVLILGGNQADAVNIASFDRTRVLGVRRLYAD